MKRPRKPSAHAWATTDVRRLASVPTLRAVSHCKTSAVLLVAVAAWALMVSLLSITRGQPQASFVTGASLHNPTDVSLPRSAVACRSSIRSLQPIGRGKGQGPRSPHPGRKKYEGIGKRRYLERLRHRRWAAQSKYPRIFGFVEKWDDVKGEGLIRDQEKTQMYLVIRDEIGRCYHNYKTLQRAEMVEFFASDEMDQELQLPLAKNVSGPYGTYVKGSEEYRNRMLAFGGFPKRWMDTPEEYPNRVGEWWLKGKWRCF